MELVFVLVEPAVPENIGASARALKTMGFGQLRLVNTLRHQEKQARILAHGAGDILTSAKVYDDLPAALADVDLAIATSAKARHHWRDLLAPAQIRDLIAGKRGALKRVSVVFGCEESGLSNDQLACCDLLSSIPLAVTYPSLNLSQAVMLYAYELSPLQQTARDAGSSQADLGQYRALKQKLAERLPALSYGEDSTLYRWAMEKIGRLGQKDIGFLHALCDKLALNDIRGK